MKLQVEHTFDIFGQMEFYEKLWGNTTLRLPRLSEDKRACTGTSSIY